jgi:transposase
MTLTMADMSSGDGGGVAGGEPGVPGPRAGQPSRRTFTVAYKLAVLEEYDSLSEYGAKGALLRREGLYQSHVEKWRKARDRGRLAGKPARPAPAGTTGMGAPSGEAENRRLTAANKKLVKELEKTKALLEIVGKAHALLEMFSEGADSTKKPTV